MILIKNGNIYDGNGNIFEDTDILIEGKIIKEIGKSIKAPEDAEIYEASGKIVFPGFIDSLNVWGAKGPGWGDDDLDEHSDPITPDMNVVYSFDQDSMMFQRVFEYGVTSAGITPSNTNVLGGYAGVFKTYGKHPYEMLVREQVAMVASITSKSKKLYGSKNKAPMTRMGAMSLLLEEIKRAVDYKEKEDREHNSKSQAMQMLIDREVPLFINCNTKSEMDAVEFAVKDLPIDVVFTGAFGADEKTGDILERKFSVILGDFTQAMSSPNADVDFDAVRKLLDKGVDVAISSCGDDTASGKESLLWNAILCYKYGLGDSDVLKMITSIPAKILGVDEKIGSIEKGKDADIVIWTDNPIKTYSAKLEATFIDGENILHSRRENTCWS